MEEQISWKGQGFTLLVFGGIVFLCSIFFVLGMLVGRSQGQHAAESAAAATATKEASVELRTASEATSATAAYETVVTGKQSTEGRAATRDPDPVKAADVSDPVPPKPEPKPAPEPKHKVDPAPAPIKMIYLQVEAVGTSTAAKKLADDLQKKGFTALVSGGGPKDLFRVQVGPFSNNTDVELTKSKLEALGYKPIRK